MSKAAHKEAFSAAAIEDPISRALVVYTGFGKSPFPRARTGDLVTLFGEVAAADLKGRILGLFEEMLLPLPEEGKRSKKSVTERATEQMRLRHPELDDDGLKALAWTFSFGLR